MASAAPSRSPLQRVIVVLKVPVPEQVTPDLGGRNVQPPVLFILTLTIPDQTRGTTGAFPGVAAEVRIAEGCPRQSSDCSG